MCWVVFLSLRSSTFREYKMTKDDREKLDLSKKLETKVKEIETLNSIVNNLKNIIDMKDAEMTAMTNANNSHRELNGSLRKELDEVRIDNKKLAQQITDLKKEAKEMLQYP